MGKATETSCKIVLRRGGKALDLVWLTHRKGRVKSEIIVTAGIPGADAHTSYHQSGRKHVTPNDKNQRRYGMEQRPRIDELVDIVELHLLCFRNEPELFDGAIPLAEYHGKRCDVLIELDAEKIDEDVPMVIRVGVVGTGGQASFASHVDRLQAKGNWKVHHAQLYDKVSPAVWAVVLQHTGTMTESGGAVSTPVGDEILGFIPEKGFVLSSDGIRDGGTFTIRFRPGRFGPPPRPKRFPSLPERAITDSTVTERVEVRLAPDGDGIGRLSNGRFSITCAPLSATGYPPDPFVLILNPVVEEVDLPGIGRAQSVDYSGPDSRTLFFNYSLMDPVEHDVEVQGITHRITCAGISYKPAGKSISYVKYSFNITWDEPRR